MEEKMYVIQVNNGEHTYVDIKEKYLCVLKDEEEAIKYCRKMNKKTNYNSSILYEWEEVITDNEIEDYKDKAYVIIYKQYLDYVGCHYKKAIECYPTKEQAKQRKKYLNRLVKQTSNLFKYSFKLCDIYSIKVLTLKK